MSTMIEIGKSYLFHTHLGIWLGKVAAISLDQIQIDSCSWIPDQGRMSECVKKGTYNECEPLGDGVVIPSGFIAVPWRHALPTKVK